MIALGQKLPWQVYAVIVATAFTIIFVSFKWASGSITPTLFVALAGLSNCLGHCFLLYKKSFKKKLDLSFSKKMMKLSLLLGIALAFGDVSSFLMFKSGAPLSIAMPIYGAGSVLLVVLFGFLIMKERPTKLQTLGIIFSIIGIGMLNV